MRYAHFGTGNYNEITAGIYSDISLLTCDNDLCADASAFFNSITGNSQPQNYRKIEAAPLTMKDTILDHIEAETKRSKEGQKAFIRAKMNSLTHPEIIDALYKASQAGVIIQVNVRGICCLKPGIKGMSETITVKSIVGRFLEHARILHVCNGGKDKVFICTADWMQRNLDKRVELMVPVEHKEAMDRLIHILDTCFKDTENSWALDQNEEWTKNRPSGKTMDCHAEFYNESLEDVNVIKRRKRTIFEAHKPSKVKKR
jgi:polyphosphate kinase